MKDTVIHLLPFLHLSSSTSPSPTIDLPATQKKFITSQTTINNNNSPLSFYA
jgi:hypothetical protein